MKVGEVRRRIRTEIICAVVMRTVEWIHEERRMEARGRTMMMRIIIMRGRRSK